MPARKKEIPTAADLSNAQVGPIYTTAEAARMLRRSVKTILRHIESGRIHARKDGKDWLIPGSEISRFWDELPSSTAYKMN